MTDLSRNQVRRKLEEIFPEETVTQRGLRDVCAEVFETIIEDPEVVISLKIEWGVM